MSAALARAVWRFRFILTLLIAAGALLFAPAVSRTTIDNDLTSWFDPQDPIYQQYERFRDEFGGTRTLIVAIKAPSKDRLLSAESFAFIDKVARIIASDRGARQLLSPRRSSTRYRRLRRRRRGIEVRRSSTTSPRRGRAAGHGRSTTRAARRSHFAEDSRDHRHLRRDADRRRARGGHRRLHVVIPALPEGSRLLQRRPRDARPKPVPVENRISSRLLYFITLVALSYVPLGRNTALTLGPSGSACSGRSPLRAARLSFNVWPA